MHIMVLQVAMRLPGLGRRTMIQYRRLNDIISHELRAETAALSCTNANTGAARDVPEPVEPPVHIGSPKNHILTRLT